MGRGEEGRGEEGRGEEGRGEGLKGACEDVRLVMNSVHTQYTIPPHE